MVGSRICSLEEVPAESSIAFRYSELGLEREAFLTKLDDGTPVAYLNECQHWTDVRLDEGDGALVRDGDVVCQKHGATFDLETGVCDYGPCRDAVLPDVEVAVRDGDVFLADDDLDFEGRGVAARGVDGDRAGGGRIDF